MRAGRRAGVVVAALFAGATSVGGAEPPPGAKFATTPEVRATMVDLRKAVIDHHTLITHRRLPKAAAAALADQVRRAAEQLRNGANGDGRAALSGFASALDRGADAIDGTQPDRSALDGLFDLVGALESYEIEFDHPGWKSLRDQ